MATLDLDQHKSRAASRRQKHLRTPKAPVALAQAEVSAKNLTGEPNWDVFLQYLSAEVARLIDVEKTTADILVEPGVTSHEQMMTAKIRLHQARSARQMLEDVISLPKRLIEAGEKAMSLQDAADARERQETSSGGE